MNAFIFLLEYLKKYRLFYYAMFFLILSDSLFQGTIPLIYKDIFDTVFIENVKVIPVFLLCSLGVGFIFFALLNILGRYLGVKAGSYIIKDIRVSMINKFQKLSTGNQRTVRQGEFVNHFNNDLIMVEQGLILQFPFFFNFVLRIIIGIALLFYLQWLLAIIMLILMPMLFFASKPILDKSNRLQELLKKQEARMTNQLYENITLASVIKAFDLSAHRMQRFTRILDKLKKFSIQANTSTVLSGKIALTNIDLIILLTISLGVIFEIKGYLTIGSIIGFLAAILLLANAAALLAMQFPYLVNLFIGLKRIDSFLKTHDEGASDTSAKLLNTKIQELSFEQVSFGYNDQTQVLKNISFTIKAGESLGIVGESGAGKSSIITLLLKQYEPTQGVIWVNQHRLKDLDEANWLSHLGIVFQDSLLFNTTIRDNIRMGKLDASDDEIILAAKKAHIHDFIMTLPHQYHTKIGRHESNDLSGGQRQRIAIARALIRKPAVLILDEVTSALDANSQAVIYQVIEEVKKECMVIIVAHHFKGLKSVDKILLMDHGELVDSGIHDELLLGNALYRQLWEKQ